MAVKWYQPGEVSREIWDGDLWWHDNGDQIFPVNIAWCPMGGYFFATLGQWGWTHAQKLTDMGGLWTPCIEPARAECCEHNVPEGNFCDPCNRAYKEAAADPDNNNG